MRAEMHPSTAVDNDLAKHDLAHHDHAHHDLNERLSLEQKEILQSAVAKIVKNGEFVGVSASEMAELLRSGLTVRELLDYLAARTSEVA
jgi:hypothetical protein